MQTLITLGHLKFIKYSLKQALKVLFLVEDLPRVKDVEKAVQFLHEIGRGQCLLLQGAVKDHSLHAFYE